MASSLEERPGKSSCQAEKETTEESWTETSWAKKLATKARRESELDERLESQRQTTNSQENGQAKAEDAAVGMDGEASSKKASTNKEFQAKIDSELAAKLRNRSSTVAKQTAGDAPVCETPEKGTSFQAKIDAELAEKLRNRSSGSGSGLPKKTFPSPPTTSRGDTSFRAKIDSELADKLRNRSSTIQKQEAEGFVAEDPKSRENGVESTGSAGPSSSELGEKLAQRRQAADADAFLQSDGQNAGQQVYQPELYDKQCSRFCVAGGCKTQCAVQ